MSTPPLIDARPVWIEPDKIPSSGALAGLDPNPLVAAILYRRGIRRPEDGYAFTHPASQPLPRPDSLDRMGEAIDRLQQAIDSGETVGIFGDYDADGITSTAIVASALRTTMGADRVKTRLPQRAEGYGLNRLAIEEFRQAGVSLVIALDCASSDHDHAALVRDAGMDLVIVDHHHMDDAGPDGAIVVSPQCGEAEDLKALTAAGLAWLVVCALADRSIDVSSTFGADASPYLDLAALGTVADVAPLDGVNRGIVARGLAMMRQGARPGLNALIEVAGLERSNLRSTDIAYSLAPRLNAPGRLASPDTGLDLLLAPDIATARPFARQIEEINRQRKARGAQIHEEAWLAFCQEPGWESRVVFTAHSRTWEPGLIGAVASRLAEETRRPVILFHETDGHLSGSARSVEGFNLMTSLQAAEPILTRFGGHSLAAGVALRMEHIGDLGDYLATEVAKQGVSVPLPPQLRIDATLPASYLTLQTPKELARLEPFGRGNDEPLLAIRDAELTRYDAMGSDRRHLKLTCRADGRSLEAVFWGAAWRSKELVGVRRVDLAGRLSINSWNGRERLQMVLEDFRPA
jgi:single-stranded-DNA-specific exonuclease